MVTMQKCNPKNHREIDKLIDECRGERDNRPKSFDCIIDTLSTIKNNTVCQWKMMSDNSD